MTKSEKENLILSFQIILYIIIHNKIYLTITVQSIRIKLKITNTSFTFMHARQMCVHIHI